jgi:hypothetical protein
MKTIKKITARFVILALLTGLVSANFLTAEAKTTPQGQTVGTALFYTQNKNGEQILVSQIPVKQMEKDMENGKINDTVYNYSVLDRYVTTVHQEAQGFTVPEFIEYAKNLSTVPSMKSLNLTFNTQDKIRFWEIDQAGYDELDTYTWQQLYGTTRYNFPLLYYYWNYTTQDYYDPKGQMSRAEVIDYIFKNGEPTAFRLSVRSFSQRYLITDEKYGTDYNMENYWQDTGRMDNERTIRMMMPMTKDDLYNATPTASDSRYWVGNILLNMSNAPDISPLGNVEAPSAVMTEDDDNYYIRFSCATDGATVYYNQNSISPSYTPTYAYSGQAVVVPKSYFPNGTVTITAHAVKDGYTDNGVKTLTLKSGGTENAAAKLTDVSTSAWYYNAVNYVMKNGLFDAVGDSAFGPDENMSRAMLVTALYRMTGFPAVMNKPQFTDVSSDAAYADAVVWAYKNNIVSGVSDTSFDPDGNITREQFAAMLYRYAAFSKKNIATEGDTSAFSDAGNISGWASNAMSWALGNKLINGMGDGTVAPQGTATRAQAAQILMNFIKVSEL